MYIIDLFTKNSIVRKAEKKRKFEGIVADLKNQQKVKSETVIKEFDIKKVNLIDSIDAQINALSAQIGSLKSQKKTQCDLLDKQMKVVLDKTIDKFDQSIMIMKNKLKSIGNTIEAEQKSLQDVLDLDGPNTPNTPIKIGFNDTIIDTKKKSK